MPPTEGGLFELREEETAPSRWRSTRSEEHTSELQSRLHLVCRLLLEKKKKNQIHNAHVDELKVERSALGASLYLADFPSNSPDYLSSVLAPLFDALNRVGIPALNNVA